MPPDEPVKIFAAAADATTARRGGGSRRRPTSSGCWASSRETSAPLRRHRGRRRRRARCSRATPTTTSSPRRVAFAAVNGRGGRCTGDRAEFLGRNGAPGAPARARARQRSRGASAPASTRAPRSSASFELAPGEEREVVFLLGRGRRPRPGARSWSSATGRAGGGATAFERRDAARGTGCSARCRCETPDAALDLLLNRWLLYQTLACRVWGRSAFYQSGGAYGFRDQLQDVMALRLRRAGGRRASRSCAPPARQFVEGDVQHWWHPPTGRGVRTRFSDDLLWLPFVTAHYVEATGDCGDPRRGGAVPRGAAARAGRGRVLRQPRRVATRRGVALRALRARARPRARPSARTGCR